MDHSIYTYLWTYCSIFSRETKVTDSTLKTIVNSVLRFDKQNNNAVRPSHYLVHLFALTPHDCNLKLHLRRRRTEQDFGWGRKLAY